MNEANHSNGPITRDFEIMNQYGIHARPAALFVKTASRYDADIEVKKETAAVVNEQKKKEPSKD